MNIGNRIKELRKSLAPGLSQTAFGEKLGLTRDMVNNLENERVEPTKATILLISKAFGVSYQWLKDGLGPMYLPPDTDDELVDEVMAGENEFAKGVFRSFAKLGDEEWLLLRKIVDMITENKLTGPDADKT